jgi:hypothetical protein
VHGITTTSGAKFYLTIPIFSEIRERLTKYYINNPARLIKTASFGGLEAAAPNKKSSSYSIRLSNRPLKVTF